MNNILKKVIESAQNSQRSYCKFITANDVGATGGHQAGFHIHKNSWNLFFDTEGEKGYNKDVFITIKWQDDFETDSRAIYYGKGTRNEYRLTRFGKNFPFLTDENIGNLLIICKYTNNYYEAFVLESDSDIDDFIAALNISIVDVNGIIPNQTDISDEDLLLKCFDEYINSLEIDFPPTTNLAINARTCYNNSYNITDNTIRKYPDKTLLNWLKTEYDLFKQIENSRYSSLITNPFNSVELLIKTANTILNRRKSRAGKSLEHHLTEIFIKNHLQFTSQAITENNKRPDFLFPSMEAYHNANFNTENLILLAAKTTCKDRWRQVLNEGNRTTNKHLFTLQQGVSSKQLEEMYESGVQLIVPSQYISSFPLEYRDRILSLARFVEFVKEKQ